MKGWLRRATAAAAAVTAVAGTVTGYLNAF